MFEWPSSLYCFTGMAMWLSFTKRNTLALKNKSDSDRIGLKQRTCGFFRSGRRVHPPANCQDGPLFYCSSHSKERVGAAVPLQERFVTSPSTICFWNISISCFFSPLLQSSTKRIQVASTCEQAQAGSLMPLASSTKEQNKLKCLKMFWTSVKILKSLLERRHF